jgi:hypothetical protein
MIERAFHLGCAVDAPLRESKVRGGVSGQSYMIGRPIPSFHLFISVGAGLGLVVVLLRGWKRDRILDELQVLEEIVRSRRPRYLDFGRITD